MKDGKTLLSEGIKILCKNDDEIDRLITPRYDAFISLVMRYINEIELFNPAYGLVGTSDTAELVIKHILDSLSPLGIISRLVPRKIESSEKAPQIADAGSGAGLPGLPLAIAMPYCDFTLIERMGRRAGFLFNTKAVLALSNITVEENELEKTARNFDLITFRAFKPLQPKLLKTLFKICAQGGVIAAYKGRREKIEEEILPLHEAGNSRLDWEVLPYSVPFLEEERNLLIIKPKL
ncbi:MAG: 16S rRNA (guanine(527)-N(7))-methyltransferase RsmG [Treponema sp.]|jgi:16S rRNA (guanine527-N7)-methyltransferase|nr:16S rRNA (guanine(527)-N(7))-methyltransferase RsmG [Treponema sp.]